MNEVLFYHSESMGESDLSLVAEALLRDEKTAVEMLLDHLVFSETFLKQVAFSATSLIEKVRLEHRFSGPIDAMLIEYDLSTEEGVALMCLGEALMRIPDPKKQDELIKEKILGSNWKNRSGKSGMMLANAAAWGLVVSGKFLDDQVSVLSTLRRLFTRLGEPVIRTVIKRVLKQLANQFILGESIEEAKGNSKELAKKGYAFSFDMLGESALTEKDADFYFEQYQLAIQSLSGDAQTPIEKAHSVSVKLSALCPFFNVWHEKKAVNFLATRLLELVQLAKEHHVALCIDAEENDRLTMTLEVFKKVIQHHALSGWHGFGFALQTYHKGALEVIQWLTGYLRKVDRFAQIRLVKGAYWDTEIKLAQQLGLEQYPVYTEKFHTDVSYAACAKLLFEGQDVIFPQFATHNAYTLSLIEQLAPKQARYECQCLHGMGKALYDTYLKQNNGKVMIRMYAPVGVHEDLLPYLVRRILENGANSSFVNQLIDEQVEAKTLAQNPLEKVGKHHLWHHANIPLPGGMFGAARKNSQGKQLANSLHLQSMIKAMNGVSLDVNIKPVTEAPLQLGDAKKIISPHDHRQELGHVSLALKEMVPDIVACAERAQVNWGQFNVEQRADILNQAADLMHERQYQLMAAAILEAGKTYQDAIDELREAIDFLRYYANACLDLKDTVLPGPTGEENRLMHVPTGPTVCISPWNFPVAIFIGQISAALAAGNTVIAKPATQTMICAAWASQCLYDAGLPKSALQVIPCERDTAEALVRSLGVKQVALTGSNQTASAIYQALSHRSGAITPLIAETGGINVMMVDSTALPEQVVKDVMHSAFQSAGQRCSACRILCVQADVADTVIEMLIGAMAYWRVGSPQDMATEVGPVIDQAALNRLNQHQSYLDKHAKELYVMSGDECDQGTFFMPCVYEIDDLSMIDKEVFGPILHVYRYQEKDLDQVIDAINATGYGLTLGVHSRVEGFVKDVIERTQVGNNYVNRNMIGAVVGVQPFGGMGCSGTGPKAGGPSYVKRFCKEKTISTNTAAIGGNVSLLVGK